MQTVERVLERFQSPREAWAELEWHQVCYPNAKMWVRQVYAGVGQMSWAVVMEVQEPWPALVLS